MRKRLEAEEQHEKARLAEREARQRLDGAAAEAEEAARALDDVERAFEKARGELRRKQTSLRVDPES